MQKKYDSATKDNFGNFIFVTVNNSSDITAQLFIPRNIKRYKVMIGKDFIILIKRKKKLSNTLHNAPDTEFIF